MNIEAIKNWRPPQLPPDKANHWIQNSLVMILLLPLCLWLFGAVGLWVAYVLGVLLSLAIEFYQKWTKTGKFEWLDALAGSAGCTSILITGLLVQHFL